MISFRFVLLRLLGWPLTFFPNFSICFVLSSDKFIRISLPFFSISATLLISKSSLFSMSWFAGYELFFYLTEDIMFFLSFLLSAWHISSKLLCLFVVLAYPSCCRILHMSGSLCLSAHREEGQKHWRKLWVCGWGSEALSFTLGWPG